MKTTACGLDCYDACRIEVEEGEFAIRGSHQPPTGNGALCPLLNRYMLTTPRITTPRIDGKAVSMEMALDAVAKALQADKTLLWRGSGNLGVMQEITNLLIEKLGGTLTRGSLCDGAGDAGILLGRGVNRTLPLEQIAKSEVVVVWGRNITVTNSHLMPYIEGKELIVIDPVVTPIAKKATLHLQIRPRTDYYIAMMLARFLFMEGGEDEAWLEEFAPEYEEFYEFTREHRIKPILEYIGVDLGKMGEVLNLLRDRRVVFLVGAGVQKYTTGASVLHAIDSLAATLGLFGREGCGVSYLGNSKLHFSDPFAVSSTRVSKATTPFDTFDTVIVQGGNPVASMPDTTRVLRSLASVDQLIYFGLYENETSQRATIVIPAKNFFEKEDLRLSYGHHYVTPMNAVVESEIGISEYDFTQALYRRCGFEPLPPLSYYRDFWLNQCQQVEEGYLSAGYEATPYQEGFGEAGEEFVFIDAYEDDFINPKHFTKVRKKTTLGKEEQEFWLISPKSAKSLNTQFIQEGVVWLNPQLGYRDGERVRVSSTYGSYGFSVKVSEGVREDCLVIYANATGVNYLTPSLLSEEGESACYQEVKVQLALWQAD